MMAWQASMQESLMEVTQGVATPCINTSQYGVSARWRPWRPPLLPQHQSLRLPSMLPPHCSSCLVAAIPTAATCPLHNRLIPTVTSCARLFPHVLHLLCDSVASGGTESALLHLPQHERQRTDHSGTPGSADTWNMADTMSAQGHATVD